MSLNDNRKWQIGTIIAVMAIVIPLGATYYLEEKKKKDKEILKISIYQKDKNKIKNEVLPIIDTLLYSASGGDLPIPANLFFMEINPNFFNQGSLSSSAEESTEYRSTISALMKNIQWLSDNLEKCNFIDERMIIPLKSLTKEYELAVEIIDTEINYIKGEIVKDDLQEMHNSIAQSYGKTFVTERYTSINGC